MDVEKPRNVALGVVVEPVNPQELYQVIADASSQDPTRVQSSTNRLKEMFSMLGTSDGLQAIAVQKSVPTPIRQQAIIQLKNSALGNWRSRRYELGLYLPLTDVNRGFQSSYRRAPYPNPWPLPYPP